MPIYHRWKNIAFFVDFEMQYMANSFLKSFSRISWFVLIYSGKFFGLSVLRWHSEFYMAPCSEQTVLFSVVKRKHQLWPALFTSFTVLFNHKFTLGLSYAVLVGAGLFSSMWSVTTLIPHEWNNTKTVQVMYRVKGHSVKKSWLHINNTIYFTEVKVLLCVVKSQDRILLTSLQQVLDNSEIILITSKAWDNKLP